jgi:hypothetical protein
MTGTNCDLFTHKSSRSYLNHLVDTLQLIFDAGCMVLFCSRVLSRGRPPILDPLRIKPF